MLVADAVQAAGEVAATCGVPGDAARREWALMREGTPDEPRWRLVFRSPYTGPGPVTLPLPLAQPEIGPGHVTLDFRSANGGRAVEWRARAAGPSTIDVFVNYELEVNVERDLDRAVDAMNTDGPLSVRCQVAGAVPARDRPLISEWTIGAGVARSVALQQSRSGRHYAITTIAWGRDLTGDLGPRGVRGRLMWAVEVVPLYSQSAPTHTWGAGALPLVWRWRFVPGLLAAPYVELGFGGLITQAPVPEGAASANFIGHGGFGVRWRPAARVSLVTAYRFQHISNGNQRPVNPGVNAHVLWLGVSAR